jgi:hypothetical protein
LYTPEEAAAAMLAGRVLQNGEKKRCYWKKDIGNFVKDGTPGFPSILDNFSGLYEEARYV